MNYRILTTLLILGLLGGCTLSKELRTEIREIPVEKIVRENPPGAVDYIWEEPMVDVIDVPPGLDPEGHYYRPGHQEVVEIRQGRWRYIKQQRD